MTNPDPAVSAPSPGVPSRRRARKGEPGLASRGAGPGGTTSPRSSRERAVAEKPDPVTGAAPSSRAAPGRGRAQGVSAGGESPAGCAGGTGLPSAGSKARAALTAPVSLADLQAAAMSEDKGPDSLDAHVRRLMRDLGLHGFHAHNAQRSAKGYPDWTIAGPGGQLWRELKTQRGRLTREQQEWLDVLAAGGGNAGVWRPEHLLSGVIASELMALAGLRGAT